MYRGKEKKKTCLKCHVKDKKMIDWFTTITLHLSLSSLCSALLCSAQQDMTFGQHGDTRCSEKLDLTWTSKLNIVRQNFKNYLFFLNFVSILPFMNLTNHTLLISNVFGRACDMFSQSSTRHRFVPNIDTAVCDTALWGGRGPRPQLWWGWSLAGPGVRQQWKTLFFPVTLNKLPSSPTVGVYLWGQYGRIVYVQGLPSRCHAVCQIQHYNSGGIVCPVCLFCSCEVE